MGPVLAIVLTVVAACYVALPRLGMPTPHPWDDGDDGDDGDGGTRTRFVPVPDAAALDPLFAASAGAPAVLFLHDKGCPISRAAYRQMERLGGEVPLVDVQRAKDVSRAIEARTGVRHESPQVIVLRHGRAVWSASHYAISVEAVARALGEEE